MDACGFITGQSMSCLISQSRSNATHCQAVWHIEGIYRFYWSYQHTVQCIPYGLGAKCPCVETGCKIREDTLSWGITYIYNLYLYIYTVLHSLSPYLCILNYCWGCNCNELLWASFLFPFTWCHYSHVVTGDNIFCNDEGACLNIRGSLSRWALLERTVCHAQESTIASANLLHVLLHCRTAHLYVADGAGGMHTLEYFKLHLTFTRSQEATLNLFILKTNIFPARSDMSHAWLNMACRAPVTEGTCNYGANTVTRPALIDLESETQGMCSKCGCNQTAPAIVRNKIIIWPAWPWQEPH